MSFHGPEFGLWEVAEHFPLFRSSAPLVRGREKLQSSPLPVAVVTWGVRALSPQQLSPGAAALGAGWHRDVQAALLGGRRCLRRGSCCPQRAGAPLDPSCAGCQVPGAVLVRGPLACSPHRERSFPSLGLQRAAPCLLSSWAGSDLAVLEEPWI